jgi:hypothetical protein
MRRYLAGNKGQLMASSVFSVEAALKQWLAHNPFWLPTQKHKPM